MRTLYRVVQTQGRLSPNSHDATSPPTPPPFSEGPGYNHREKNLELKMLVGEI